MRVLHDRNQQGTTDRHRPSAQSPPGPSVPPAGSYTGDRPEFVDCVKKAKLLVENQYERKLDRDKPAGAIFALKNMGWSDRQQLELRGSLAHLDLSQLPDHLLARIAAGEHPLSVLASSEPVAALPASRQEKEEEE